MVKIQEAIVVEGRYDKNKLSQIVDTPIFQTNGFSVMNDKAQLALLRAVAERQGLVVFTDSDGAGFVIRNFLKSAIRPEYLKHAYIPDIDGKEHRKSAPSKEGKLGVEGMTTEVILNALRNYGATFLGGSAAVPLDEITKVDMFYLGLSGNPNSSLKRKALLRMLQLPEHMSANAMLEALNVLYSKEEIYRLVDTL